MFRLLISFRMSDPDLAADTAAAQNTETAVTYHCQPGPWGNIDYQTIYLAAPDDILGRLSRAQPAKPNGALSGARRNGCRHSGLFRC